MGRRQHRATPIGGILRSPRDAVDISRNQPFDDHDIKPTAIEACMFLVDADLTKAMFSAERAAGLIERKNARQQFPQSQAFRFTDQSGDQQITHAAASPVATDVHRKFANTAITFPRPVRCSASPADDFALDLRNYCGITISDGSKPRLLFFRRSRLGFIRCDAVLDALIVNLSDRRSVVYGGVPNLYAVRLCTFVRTITPVPLRPLLHRSLARMPVALRATPAWRT